MKNLRIYRKKKLKKFKIYIFQERINIIKLEI